MGQKGFVNIMIIIVGVIVLAGVAGYFAFFKKSEQIAKQPTPSVYDIGDLGIQFTLPVSLSDLTYKVVRLGNDQAVNSVEFSSKRLEAAGCNLQTAPLGYLTYDNDKGGVIVGHARNSDLYYISPKGQCQADAALQNWHVLQDALKSLVTDDASKEIPQNPPATTNNSSSPVQPPSSSVGNWNVYQNDQYGFEVKFPPQWNKYNDHIKSYGIGFGQNDGYGFDITAISTNQTLEQYLKEKDQATAQHGPIISVEWTKNITISGLPAVQRGEFANVPGWENVVTYVPRNGIIFELTKVGRYSGSLADSATYNKILSTFKFVK